MLRRCVMNTALLCESCGYEIGGLRKSGACPECGRPIARSVPDARRGSPWQRRSSLFTLAETNWEAAAAAAALRGCAS